MNLYKRILFFVLCLNNCSVQSQHIEKCNELSHLTISTQEMVIILDSVVNAEKKCSYYNQKLIFLINIRKVESAYSVIIESVNDSNISQGSNPYGYLFFQNHLIIVDGDSCDSVFKLTKRKRKFRYVKYDPYYKVKDKEQIVYSFNDDSYSIWVYWYIEDKFIFESKSSSCY